MPTATKLTARIDSVTSKGALICICWTCPNCGAPQVTNTDSQEHGRSQCSWCPVCEDECDPAPLASEPLFAALPECAPDATSRDA